MRILCYHESSRRRPYAPRKHSAPAESQRTPRGDATAESSPAYGVADSWIGRSAVAEEQVSNRKEGRGEQEGRGVRSSCSRARARDPRRSGPDVPRRHLRADPSKRLGTGGGNDSFRAVHRCSCQHGYARTISEVSHRPTFRRARARRTGARHPLDWLLPQQVEVGRRSGSQGRFRLRRRCAADDGRTSDPSRRRTQDRQRRARHVVQEERRRGGGYARHADHPPPGADQARRSGEDRAGFNADSSARTLDEFFPPDNLAWTKAVCGARSEVLRVWAGKALSRRRQDLVNCGYRPTRPQCSRR